MIVEQVVRCRVDIRNDVNLRVEAHARDHVQVRAAWAVNGGVGDGGAVNAYVDEWLERP
jgi:hypothetical protein